MENMRTEGSFSTMFSYQRSWSALPSSRNSRKYRRNSGLFRQASKAPRSARSIARNPTTEPLSTFHHLQVAPMERVARLFRHRQATADDLWQAMRLDRTRRRWPQGLEIGRGEHLAGRQSARCAQAPSLHDHGIVLVRFHALDAVPQGTFKLPHAI